MKPNDIFSIRDFFNYYFAGLLWFLDSLLFILLFLGTVNFQDKLIEFNSFANQFSPAIGAITLVIIPYLFGFIFNSVSTKTMKFFRNGNFDALNWVTDSSDKRASEGLKEWEKETIKLRMKELYKIHDQKFNEMFFTIRAYIEEHSQGANLLATSVSLT